jgi:hypothetical protein
MRPKTGLIPWILVAVLAIGLLAVGVWFMVDYLTPTDTEAMLRDYVSDWEGGDFASLPGYFALGGTLVDGTTGSSFAVEEIAAELTDLAGTAAVDVHDLVVGSSDRIASARFEVISEVGDSIDGVAVWETVGGTIRQQTITYVTVYESR